MDIWLSERIEVTIEPDVKDELNLRWDRQIAVNNANLLTKLFHSPNCINPSPGGVGVWDNVEIGNTKIRIIITDTNKDCMELSMVCNVTKDHITLFNDRCWIEPGSRLGIKCSYFREGFGILFALTKLSSGDTFFEAFRLYNRLMSMGTKDLEVFFMAAPQVAKAASDVSKENVDVVPRIIENTTSLPQGGVDMNPKSVNVEKTSIPTVIGTSVNVANTQTSAHLDSIYSDIRTPEGVPVTTR